MKAAAQPTGLPRWLGADPWPKIFAAVTLVAFGSALAVSVVRPWGHLAAAVLVVIWGIFALSYGRAEARHEGRPGIGMNLRQTFRRRPLVLVIGCLFLLAFFVAWSRQAWLIHQDAPLIETTRWGAAAGSILLLAHLARIVTNAIYAWLERRAVAGHASGGSA